LRKLKISSATKLVIKLLRLQREQQYSRIIKCCWFKEEAGIDITVEKLVAIHDSNKHYKGMYPYGISQYFSYVSRLVEALKKTMKLLQVIILR
jgi:hypothetical protein